MGSAESEQAAVPGGSVCQWRTARYHDQECSLFFDCPSHFVERAPSDDGDAMDVDSGGPAPRAPAIEESGPGISNNVGEEEEVLASSSRAPAPGERGGRPSGSTSGAEAQRLTVEGAPSSSRNPPAILVQDESRPGPVRPQLQTSPGAHPLIDAARDSSSYTVLSSLLAAQRSPPTTPRDLPIAPPPPPPPPHSPDRQRLSTSNAPLAGPSQQLPGGTGPEIVLPRWQPDAEVTYCPICNTQFSIFVRKHHCR